MTEEAKTFQGFKPPEENWSKLPHELIEALPQFETVAEMKVVLYVLRHTWGYREYEQRKRITIDEFMNGRKRNDGSRIDNGTGMSKSGVIDGLRNAVKHGFLTVEEDATDKARIKHSYGLAIQGSPATTSEVASGDIGGSQKLPRTEKETIERNQKKESSAPSRGVDNAVPEQQSLIPNEAQETPEPVTPLTAKSGDSKKKAAADPKPKKPKLPTYTDLHPTFIELKDAIRELAFKGLLDNGTMARVTECAKALLEDHIGLTSEQFRAFWAAYQKKCPGCDLKSPDTMGNHYSEYLADPVAYSVRNGKSVAIQDVTQPTRYSGLDALQQRQEEENRKFYAKGNTP